MTTLGRFAILPAITAVLSCGAPSDDPAGSGAQLVAEVRIGSETGGPEYQFTTLRDIAAHGENVYVVQRGVNEIRVFGADGLHRKTIGRQGAGPGEFESIWSFGVVGDSLWAIDVNLRRLTYFTLNGDLVSTMPFEPVPLALGSAGGPLFLPYPDVVLPDLTYLGFGRGMASSVDEGVVTAYPLLHIARDGSTRDTVGWVSIKNEDLILRSARSRSYMPQPFTDSPITVYAPAKRRAYVIERWSTTEANSGSVRVIALGASGDTSWVREIPYTPAPLEAHIVDSVRSGLERARAGRYPPEEIRRALYAPAYRTPIRSAVAAVDGTLWLRWDSVTVADRYAVITADGQVRTGVKVPSRVRIRWVSDSTAWGEELDENDVPTVVRYRIRAVGAGDMSRK